jgi:Flp pilus assembly protein TadD
MRTLLFPVVVAACAACASTSSARREGDVAAARKQLARALLDRGDAGGARDAVEPLCRAHRPDPEALALRGVAYQQQGLVKEAEADLREAVTRNDRLAFAHSALAILLDLGGRASEAERHHRRALALSPREPRYLNNLAFSLFARGDARGAIPVFLEAARADPTNARVRNNLGFAYAVAGDFARAREEFERGGDPRQARVNLAFAYERTGALAQAYELYVEVVRHDPDDATARADLARVAQKLGRPTPPGEAGKVDGTGGGGL